MSELMNKEENILFIIKLEGFRNSFLRHQIVTSKSNSALSPSTPYPVVVSSEDQLT